MQEIEGQLLSRRFSKNEIEYLQQNFITVKQTERVVPNIGNDGPRDAMARMGGQYGDENLRTVHYSNYELNVKALWEAGKTGFKVSAATGFSDGLLTVIGAILGGACRTFSEIESAVVQCVNQECKLPSETASVFEGIEDCLKKKNLQINYEKFEQTILELDRFKVFEIKNDELRVRQKIVHVKEL